ncbi:MULTISPECIES: FtsX-like permease family protein [Cytobacillus]|uniref:Bacitracin ABC transporter permease n=1 Tax=Cytobacillus oceanisediminis 2691 TaxID=1196031 RepID=A0A160MBK3_9BACI|nr:FtsX-like permease family protein [Cytobacillus oceanisediminis]AND40226.1 bacitracin ABC transporter permease [Cytobacillus oceanisediminis 2691]MBU8728484.1 FtsX-like permease family protein [Cytobacillus oceanisediminis]MCM3405804.1 FtsX-like permease family protein [Cytobacillus oceanisediminis]MCM3530775.1 FtsX-like permease family protein [Cytobacillus oceanisediminis]MDK7669465.1 FtsX-like permease family protein [Cytobacillus oceanisediminis]
MSINTIILRNLKKNLKNYYLYVFALIFSVALYFAFVTLQYDPSMSEAKGSIKGAAAIKTASILLVAIVSIFLLYANTIFIKRRSKEIGLFQLIGMTKNEIFRLLSLENLLLYFGSLIIGIFIGFSVSKLILMVLFKLTGVEGIASLHFSSEALLQTVIVFTVIYIFIMLMNFVFIKRQTILSLFRVVSIAEGKVKKLSILEMILGVLGLALIIAGYYISSLLFGGDFTSMNELFLAMVVILASVIIGTYLFYKGSVSFIASLIRKRKDGYLNVNEVLSLSSIMFRMKSSALLLTIITTVSALAIGLLSLSYISYYSAEKSAQDSLPSHFSFTDKEDAGKFTGSLQKEGLEYKEKSIELLHVDANMEDILDVNLEEMNFDSPNMILPVVSETSIDGIKLSPKETVLTGYNDALQKFMTLKDSGELEFMGKTNTIKQKYLGLKKDFVLPFYFTSGGLPVAIVDEKVYEDLKADLNPELQDEDSLFIGVDMKSDSDIEKANTLFKEMEFSGRADSQQEMSTRQKMNMGLIMFIVGFLGLTFLVTSGCILYFKQMDQSEDEKPNYTILRKLGFTQGDLLRGIQSKMAFNFGIPLIVGLLHSYFAVQSGWFFFGSELWMPMILVMVLYTVLYSIFGILSVIYSKKVIKDAL